MATLGGPPSVQNDPPCPPSPLPHTHRAMKGLECRSGFYCPSPLAQLPCPQGAFCGPGSVAPTTCAMDELLRTSPNMELPQRPTTVYSSVYVDGDTLGGNYCPANSSTPSTQCAGGTYCPSPGLALPCPKGSFCKPGSKDPSPCPFLTSCPPGSSKAALSWTGFILLAGILLGLLAAYCTAEALMRMAQRRQLHTQEARDRLWKLLNPLFAPHHRRQGGCHWRGGRGGIPGGHGAACAFWTLNTIPGCPPPHWGPPP